MRHLYLFGIIFLFMVSLFGCSSNSTKVDSNEVNELNNEKSINENSAIDIELSEKENGKMKLQLKKNKKRIMVITPSQHLNKIVFPKRKWNF